MRPTILEHLLFPTLLIATDPKFSVSEKLPVVPASSVSVEPFFGTAATPQTHIDTILQTVNELARKWESGLIGETGWFHLQTQVYVPANLRGNGLPQVAMSDLFPDDVSFQDDWFHVDDMGHYGESLHLTSTVDGVIQQRVIFQNGRLLNLTLSAAGIDTPNSVTNQEQSPLVLPEFDALATLSTFQEWDRTFQAWLSDDNTLYTVRSEQVSTKIVEIANSPEPIQGDRLTYVFNWQTGQLVSAEFQVLTQSNSWLTTEKRDYLVAELLVVLPANIEQVFQESIAQLKGDN